MVEEATVTCVIVAFHDPQSVAMLAASLVGERQVIVVNIEADHAVRRVAQEAGATVIDVHENVGYAAAVNRGVAVADGDVVVFMNDDLQLTAADVEALAAVVRAGPAAVAVPAVVTSEGSPERTVAALPGLSSLVREYLLLPDAPIGRLVDLLKAEKWRLPSVPEQVDAAAAIVVACRTALLREIPLPEAYFLYWEESEWFWHLRRHAVVTEYRPEIVCVHLGGRADVRPEKSRLLARNAVRCIRRTHGRPAALVAVPVVVAWNVRLLLTALTRLIVDPSPARRAAARARKAGTLAALASWREVL